MFCAALSALILHLVDDPTGYEKCLRNHEELVRRVTRANSEGYSPGFQIERYRIHLYLQRWSVDCAISNSVCPMKGFSTDTFNGTAPELAQALLESADIPPQIRAKTLNCSSESISILLKTNPILSDQDSPESVHNARSFVDLLLLAIPIGYQTLDPPVDVLDRLSFRTMGPARQYL